MAKDKKDDAAPQGLSDPFSWAGKNGPNYVPISEGDDDRWKGGAGSVRGVVRGRATPTHDLRPETRGRGRKS